jgi:hypothetical protein
MEHCCSVEERKAMKRMEEMPEDGGDAKGWNGMKEDGAMLYLRAEDDHQEDEGDSQRMECYEGG